jgi:hypothetical protein
MKISKALSTVLLATALGASVGCAHISSAGDRDLVILGHVHGLLYEAIDEYGLSGRITARLSIARVLQGRAPAEELIIQYIAHQGFPEDREVRLHLRQAKDGSWIVCGGDGRGYVCR